MPKLLKVELTLEERRELEEIRERHEKAYMRERAAAIIKVASIVRIVVMRILLTILITSNFIKLGVPWLHYASAIP